MYIKRLESEDVSWDEKDSHFQLSTAADFIDSSAREKEGCLERARCTGLPGILRFERYHSWHPGCLVRQDVNCSPEVLTIGSESTKIDLSTAEERCTALEHGKLQQRLDEGLYLSAADPIV
jgi:hypothetical protein